MKFLFTSTSSGIKRSLIFIFSFVSWLLLIFISLIVYLESTDYLSLTLTHQVAGGLISALVYGGFPMMEAFALLDDKLERAYLWQTGGFFLVSIFLFAKLVEQCRLT